MTPQEIRAQLAARREEALGINRLIARHLQAVIPKGWTGKVHFVVDNGVLRDEDVVVEFRISTRTHRM